MSRVPLKRKTATRVYESEGYTNVRYHYTDVVRFNDTEIVLNSGGWRTNTTKSRMNQAAQDFGLGFSVFQKNFDWFVDFMGKTVEFKDGMVLNR